MAEEKIRTFQELRKAAEKRAKRTMRFNMLLPASRKEEQSIASGAHLNKIIAILGEAQCDEEFSSAVAELIREYEGGQSDLFPDYTSWAPIILATRTNPKQRGHQDENQEFRLWFDYPDGTARKNHVDSHGRGMLLGVYGNYHTAISGLIKKLPLSFLDKPRFVLPENGTQVYARNPISICRLKAEPAIDRGFREYFIDHAGRDWETRIQDETSSCEEVVFRG